MIIECLETQINVEKTEDNEIFKSQDEMQKALSRFCYGDLYVIGRIWIQALRTMLVGADISLIPTVKAAAKPTEVPQKPPPMKYTDLPLYTSPHNEYKDYISDIHKCPKCKVKILHEFLAPHVTSCRIKVQKTYQDVRCTIQRAAKDICTSISDNKRDFKGKMRCPDNILMRQAVLLIGGTAGFLVGGGRGIPRRIFCTGAGLFSAGALCFPVEADDAFRNLSYRTAKFIISVYNSTCNKTYLLRERVPCRDDVPPPPPPGRKTNPCPPKK